MPDDAPRNSADPQLPGICLVTPAFNAGRYIGETISSVLAQRYPNLEYVVVDGGSEDDTTEIIRRHEGALRDWISEPDEGMYDAINKGFARCDAELMGWINADDTLLPGTLRTIGEVFSRFPDVEWISTRTPIAIDEHGSIIKHNRHPAFSSRGFRRGDHFVDGGWPAKCYLQQEGTFWRRSLWEKAGAQLDTSYKLAGDFELWCRFAKHAQLVSIDVPLGAFRYHPQQASGVNVAAYISEAQRAYESHGHKRPSLLRRWSTKGQKALSDNAVHWLAQRRLLHNSPRITYDWGGRSWVLEEARAGLKRS